ncbi:MAG: hypothetical protein ACRCWQ_12175 [Bacilli bacterium]
MGKFIIVTGVYLSPLFVAIVCYNIYLITKKYKKNKDYGSNFFVVGFIVAYLVWSQYVLAIVTE